MAAIDSAYHYYLSTYGTSGVSRYDTHKKSQLRAVYNNIVKTNKDSPLYKIKDSGDIKKFAIDIKEHTRSIQNVIASLSDADDGMESVFNRKIAESTDEDAVSAEYIGPGHGIDDSLHFNVEVTHLATPQINQGHYLPENKYDLKPGSYGFDLSTDLSSYEFQFSVGQKDTNYEVQQKLLRLINSSGIGLKASILEDEQGKSALQIESKQTGLSENQNYLFEILPSPDNGSIKVMRTLGIDHVKEKASNSTFLLNGQAHSSLSNTFTINNAFELTLNGISEDGNAAQIGFKANADAIADNVASLVTVYNNMIQLSHHYTDSQQSNKLLRDMVGVTGPYYNELESIGLSLTDDGSLSIDRNLLTDAVTSEDAMNCFHVLNEFKNDLNSVAANASIDPMNYVDKVLIAYKNPIHNFASPYITSIYSGMMLDRFC